MPSFVVLQVSISDKFLAAERAGEHFFPSVGPYMLEKTALMLIFFATPLERAFLDFVLVQSDKVLDLFFRAIFISQV
jgi:hypothetical protein